MMKKILMRGSAARITAFILALLMVLAFMPVLNGQYAHAAEDETIELTDEQKAKLENGEVDLTNEQISQLQMQSDEGKKSVVEGSQLEISDIDIEKIPADMSFAEGKGMKSNGNPGYEESDDGFQSDHDKFGPFTPSGTYPAFNVDDSKNCEIDSEGKILTYEFTPAENGVYWLWSEGNYDTIGRVVEYDEVTGEYRQRTHDDDGVGDSNFQLSFYGKAGKKYYLQARIYNDDETGDFVLKMNKDSFDPSSMTLTVDTSKNKSKHIITVSGSVTGDTFDDVYIDNEKANTGIGGQSSFNGVQIDMTKFEVGVHTLTLRLQDHPESGFWKVYEYGIPTYIYKKPAIKISDFLTTYNHVALRYSGSYYENCGVYFIWKKAGGSWSKTITGPVSTDFDRYTAEAAKLKASTNYTAKSFFGKMVQYGGKNIAILGSQTGYYSTAKTVKTAGKKLKIKSVKISKVSQKTRKKNGWHVGYIRDPYYGTWHLGLINGPYTSTTTKFNIKVTFKSKPGAAGIYIGNKRIKGNKKSYSAKFELGGKYKGKKLTFSFMSYQSNSYSSYSPVLRKKIKIK